jgi:U3 small nucleolar RNA-associated protein 15
MDYQPVVVQKHPRPSISKTNPDSRYWRQFKNPVFVKEYAPVTSVHFSPSKPHRYAVTAATRVQIYAPRTQKVTKTISRFKDVARSGNIRGDGKLVVAGDDTGLIQVCFFKIYCLKKLIAKGYLDFRYELSSHPSDTRFT